MGLLTKGYLILKYPQRRKILRRDLGYTKASIDGVGIGGSGYPGPVYLSLEPDITLIYRYTNIPNYQWLGIVKGIGWAVMPILITSWTCPLYLRETCNSGGRKKDDFLPFEIPAATQYFAS